MSEADDAATFADLRRYGGTRRLMIFSTFSIVVAVATSACGGKKSLVQGKVTGDHVACKATEMHGRFDCATVLRDYLHANADARIAGVNVIYGEGRDELLVWRTQSDAWPKASTLEVDNHECSPTSASDPGCATVIDDLTTAKPSKHHYFIVPVFGSPDQPASRGTWSVLDVRSATSGASGDAGWDSAKTELLRCALQPGEPYLMDHGDGVMHATQVGSDFLPDGSEDPSECYPVLINYLRAHADERIAGIVALDGRLTNGSSIHESGDHGTVALMVFVGAAPWPASRSLSVDFMACPEATCLATFAEMRPKLDVSPRVLFTVPIGEELHEQPKAGKLLMISAPR